MARGEPHPLSMPVNELSIILLPNSPMMGLAYAWMEDKFKTQGDTHPRDEQIHLESITKKEIYNEYVNDMEVNYKTCTPMSYDEFVRLWIAVFNHVKIRKFKAVTGKCNTCATLTDLRSKTRNSSIMKAIATYHALHRFTYMQERRMYYQKIVAAVSNPDEFMSVILDGMAQVHTDLPYYGNKTTFAYRIAMHLLGLLEHGQKFVMFRTFGNVKCDGDLVLYCLFSQIENRRKRFGRLPPTLYLQTDGGSENANATMLGMLELLVIRGVFKTVVWNRLPVGHTHEGA